MQLGETANHRYVGSIPISIPTNKGVWCIAGQNCNSTQCFSGLCLPNGLERDMISDCPGFALEDELDTHTGIIDFIFIFPMICNDMVLCTVLYLKCLQKTLLYQEYLALCTSAIIRRFTSYHHHHACLQEISWDLPRWKREYMILSVKIVVCINL